MTQARPPRLVYFTQYRILYLNFPASIICKKRSTCSKRWLVSLSLTVSPCDFFLSSVSSFLSFVTLGLGVRAISYAKCQVLSLSEPNVRYCSVSGINDRYSSVSGQNIRYCSVSGSYVRYLSVSWPSPNIRQCSVSQPNVR